MACWIAVPFTAIAGLEWNQTQADLKAAIGDKDAKAVFEFKNTGDKPVQITSVQAGCSCTTATDVRGTYQPGATGKVDVAFQFGGRKGLQEKRVIIQTDDPDAKVLTLTLRVLIPDTVVLSKEKLVWAQGAEKEPQTVDLTFLQPNTTVRGIVATNYNFEPTIETVEEGKIARLTVKPKDTSQPLAAVVRVDLMTDEPRSIFVPVRIGEQ